MAPFSQKNMNQEKLRTQSLAPFKVNRNACGDINLHEKNQSVFIHFEMRFNVAGADHKDRNGRHCNNKAVTQPSQERVINTINICDPRRKTLPSLVYARFCFFEPISKDRVCISGVSCCGSERTKCFRLNSPSRDIHTV